MQACEAATGRGSDSGWSQGHGGVTLSGAATHTYSNALQLHVDQCRYTSVLGFGLFGCLVVASHPQARARASEEVAGSARSAKHEVEVLRSEVSELGLAVCLCGWGAAGLTWMLACCSCELYKSERANWIAR